MFIWIDQWYQYDCSSNAHERLGGVLAIDELIDVKVNAATAVTPGFVGFAHLASLKHIGRLPLAGKYEERLQ